MKLAIHESIFFVSNKDTPRLNGGPSPAPHEWDRHILSDSSEFIFAEPGEFAIYRHKPA